MVHFLDSSWLKLFVYIVRGRGRGGGAEFISGLLRAISECLFPREAYSFTTH